MNKTQLIDVVATKTDLTKKGAEAAVNAVVEAIAEALKAEGCDYSLCDTLIDWLNERIDPNTGYWSPMTLSAHS